MSAHRYQAFWRSLIFNRVYDDSGLVDDPAHLVGAWKESDYRLQSLDVTGVQSIDYRELRQLLEGAEANEAYEGVRMLTGRGLVMGANVADLEDRSWAMYESFSPAACRMVARGLDPPGVLPFDFRRATAGGSVALRAYARPALGRPLLVGRAREGLSRPFLFNLVAMDPRIYAQGETSTALGNLSGGNNTVTNAGNAYANPTIEIVTSAPGAVNLVIGNTTTGESITLDLSGEAAGTFLLDTRRARITKAGVSKYGLRVAGFLATFTLAPGANTLVVTNATSVTSVTVKHRAAYA